MFLLKGKLRVPNMLKLFVFWEAFDSLALMSGVDLESVEMYAPQVNSTMRHSIVVCLYFFNFGTIRVEDRAAL